MPSTNHISQILTELTASTSETQSIKDIVKALGDRSFALLVVLLGLPNCLPMPPPIPILCGLMLALVALQMLFNRETPWLPKAILNLSIPSKDIARAVEKAVPVFLKLEAWSMPRGSFFTTDKAKPVVGLSLFVLALGIIIATPFIGQIPIGIGVCLIGLGQVERDSVLMGAGLSIGLFGVALSAGFIVAIVSSIMAIF